MQVPVQIELQGEAHRADVHAAIERRVAQLEERYGRLTACHVLVRAPSAHHETGGLYQVSIRLALPDGREVDVGRTASADERHADLAFAVDDAFKRARRRLQDRARRMQGKVKKHEDQPVGVVSTLDQSGEFGFLQCRDGRDIYFHRNSVLNNAFARLVVGSRVLFAEEMGENGPQASTVKLLGKHALRL
jgi:cold shock CspA family protein